MIDFITDALACHRITRLVIDDAIFDLPRKRLKNRLYLQGHTKLLELLDCSWCVSIWVAVGVGACRAVVPRAWGPAARALALSSVAGLVSTVE